MNSPCWCCQQCLGVELKETRDEPGREDSNGLEDVYEFDISHPLFHVTKVLQYHPPYLQSFLEAYTFLLHETGPLPFSHRIYIGIMAVSRHQCTHLLNLLTSEFLSYQGDQKWLLGLDEVPEKLRRLDEVNKLLAHRPWLLEPAHVLKLTKGGRENWSISEVTQAIVLLVFHHSLASLFASCGIGVDENGSSPTNAEAGNSHQPMSLQRQISEVYGIDALLERMRLVEEASEDFTPEECLERFKDVERQSVDLLDAKKKKKSFSNSTPLFTRDPEFCYEDFSTQMTKMPNLRPLPLHDYSWELHGYLVANMYYVESAPFLDNKFKVARSLTYNKVGAYPNVDTRTFRTAVWNYTQCMLGIMHYDYDYEQINTLLDKSLRTYIKSVTCFPETVTRAAYEGFMTDLLPSEKVHINIMIHEAKFQGELLFGFRTIANYMSKDW